MRQYRIFYKRGKTASFTAIQPAGGLHDKLIDHKQIRDAIEHMRLNPMIEGVSLRIDGNEMFNVIAFDQEAEAPNAFKFSDEPVVNPLVTALMHADTELGLIEQAVTLGNDIGQTVLDRIESIRRVKDEITAAIPQEDTVLAEPSEAPKVEAPTDLRVTHYEDGRVEVRKLPTVNGRPITPPETLAEHREMKRENIAAIYGADPAQQPVDGDTANDGLLNQ